MLQNTWWCVRHGQAENNLKPLVTGRAGGPILSLTEVGKEQAREAAKKDSEWDIIIASPYLRAQQTAEIFAQKRNMRVFTEDRFEEIFMGDIEGKPKQAHSDFVLTHAWTDPFPHGESFEDGGKRALEAVLEWDKKFEGKRILFVSHTGLLRGLLAVIDIDLGSDDLPHAQPFPLPFLKKIRK